MRNISRYIEAIPSGAKRRIPALLINTSSSFPPRAFSASVTADLMLDSLVASSWMKTTLPSELETRDSRAGDWAREVAMIVPISEEGKERR